MLVMRACTIKCKSGEYEVPLCKESEYREC